MHTRQRLCSNSNTWLTDEINIITQHDRDSVTRQSVLMIEKSIKLTVYPLVLNHVLILSPLSSLIYDSKETISTETHRGWHCHRGCRYAELCAASGIGVYSGYCRQHTSLSDSQSWSVSPDCSAANSHINTHANCSVTATLYVLGCCCWHLNKGWVSTPGDFKM